VREAFHTEIHQLSVKGAKHFANMSDPRIPAALAPAVIGVVSLHDFKPRAMHKLRAQYTEGGGYYLVVPGDLATIYNLNPLFTAGISGQGQTIAVIEDTNVYTTADWTKFRSVFGLSSYTGATFTTVHPAPPTGTNNCTNPGVNSDDEEAILDAEYASAAAPSADIELASCLDTSTFGGLIALQNLLNGSSAPPALVSISYGYCETLNGATANAAYNAAYQQAAGEGVSVFVSSGDEGAASCDADESWAVNGITVSGFTSTPYNVSVGGTDFGDSYAGTNSTYWNTTNSSTYESALSYIDEIPWNDSCAGALLTAFFGYSEAYGSSGFCNSSAASENGYLTTVSGSGGPSGCATGSSTSGVVGGSCAGWPKPSWQSLVGDPSDGVRDIPDVSLFAANGSGRHVVLFADHGRHSGSGEPANRRTAGQSESGLLQPGGCRVWSQRQ
jgi:subtilase family serine protease